MTKLRWFLFRLTFPAQAAMILKSYENQRAAAICRAYHGCQNPKPKSNREDLLDFICKIEPGEWGSPYGTYTYGLGWGWAPRDHYAPDTTPMWFPR